MNKFESRIKELRLQKGLTYSQLASEFGKSEGAIRAWETGRTKPDADTLIKLAEYFECSTDYLLGLNDFKSISAAKELDKKFKRAVTADASLGLASDVGLLDAALYLVLATANLNAFQKNNAAKFLRKVLVAMGNAEFRTMHLFTQKAHGELFEKAGDGIFYATVDGEGAWREALNEVSGVYMEQLIKYEAENPNDPKMKSVYRSSVLGIYGPDDLFPHDDDTKF